MIVELVSVLAIVVGGGALMRSVGITGWALPVLGYLAGIALLITVGSGQVLAGQLWVGFPTAPALTLALTAGLPVAWWLSRRLRGHDVSVAVLPTVGGLAVIAGAVVALRWSNLVSYHYDSFRYLMSSAMLANGTFDAGTSPNLVTKRLLGVPVVHAPAQLAGEYHLRSVFPLLAVATVAALVWFFRQGAPRTADPARVALFATLGAVLLLSINRFVFNGFYLNGHLIFAALVMAIVASGWLLATMAEPPSLALVTLQVAAIPAVVVTRVEGPLLLILAVLPTVLSARVPVRYRAAVLASLGASTTLWQGYQVVILRDRGTDIPLSASGQLLLGLALLAAVPLVRWRLLTRRALLLLWTAEVALWLALAALTVRHPEMLLNSVRATRQNVVGGSGSWGASMAVLGIVAVALLVLVRMPRQTYLRFPLTTFIPMAFLLAFLRDAAYRVGDHDSLNRMIIQYVPLAVLFVIATMTFGEWRLRPRPPATAAAPAHHPEAAEPAGAISHSAPAP